MRIVETLRGKYKVVCDADCAVAINMYDNGDYFEFDQPNVSDEEVKKRVEAVCESSRTVQEQLIDDIEALVEEYIMSDDTYQDLYKELNWLNIGEDKADYRLNIEIRKNP